MDNIVVAGISCTVQRNMTLFGASASYSVWPRPEPRTTDSEKCLCSNFNRITTFYRYKFSQIILLSGNVFYENCSQLVKLDDAFSLERLECLYHAFK